MNYELLWLQSSYGWKKEIEVGNLRKQGLIKKLNVQLAIFLGNCWGDECVPWHLDSTWVLRKNLGLCACEAMTSRLAVSLLLCSRKYEFFFLEMNHPLHIQKNHAGIVAHTFNPSMQEGKAGRSLCFRPASCQLWVLGQLAAWEDPVSKQRNKTPN